MDEKLYTVRQVAEIMHLHENSVRRWIALGRLQAVKLHGTVRVPAASLARAMALHSGAPARSADEAGAADLPASEARALLAEARTLRDQLDAFCRRLAPLAESGEPSLAATSGLCAGVVDVRAEGCGEVRDASGALVHLSEAQIRRYSLRSGDWVSAEPGPPSPGQDAPSAARILEVRWQ